MIKIQGSFRENARVKRELILSVFLFLFNVECLERDIDLKRSALLKELLCIFGSNETVLPGP